MIVDDDIMNQIALESVVNGIGVKSDKAISGFQAIEMFKSRISAHKLNGALAPLYKVMLIDYSMPGMSGPELAVKIHELA